MSTSERIYQFKINDSGNKEIRLVHDKNKTGFAAPKYGPWKLYQNYHKDFTFVPFCDDSLKVDSIPMKTSKPKKVTKKETKTISEKIRELIIKIDPSNELGKDRVLFLIKEKYPRRVTKAFLENFDQEFNIVESIFDC